MFSDFFNTNMVQITLWPRLTWRNKMSKRVYKRSLIMVLSNQARIHNMQFWNLLLIVYLFWYLNKMQNITQVYFSRVLLLQIYALLHNVADIEIRLPVNINICQWEETILETVTGNLHDLSKAQYYGLYNGFFFFFLLSYLHDATT